MCCAERTRGWAAARLARLALLLVVLAMALPGCVFVTGDVNPFSRRPKPLEERVVSGEGRAKLLILDISGLITSEERSGTLGIGARESTISRVEAELQRAARDKQVTGLIVRVNSPGGTVTASDIVYERLMRFKAEQAVPVVAELMDLATSGGYYTALAADKIIAHPTTVTGSIGVVFSSISAAGLLDKIGVRDQTVTTGEMKDIGSPLRTMTPKERQVLETMLGDMHERFVSLVRERRPNVTEEMETVMIDGRVFGAQQALAGKLIDRIGYLEDAIELAKQQAGVQQAKVVMYRRPDEFSSSVYSRAAPGPAQVNLINIDLAPLLGTPQFLYLWMP